MNVFQKMGVRIADFGKWFAGAVKSVIGLAIRVEKILKSEKPSRSPSSPASPPSSPTSKPSSRPPRPRSPPTASTSPPTRRSTPSSSPSSTISGSSPPSSSRPSPSSKRISCHSCHPEGRRQTGASAPPRLICSCHRCCCSCCCCHPEGRPSDPKDPRLLRLRPCTQASGRSQNSIRCRLRFVSGHEFTRAESRPKKRGLEPPRAAVLRSRTTEKATGFSPWNSAKREEGL